MLSSAELVGCVSNVDEVCYGLLTSTSSGGVSRSNVTYLGKAPATGDGLQPGLN